MFDHETCAAMAGLLGGVLVSETSPGSPEARAGVLAGDIILSVNGIRTRTEDDYLTALGAGMPRLVIVVFRRGSEVTLEWNLPTLDDPFVLVDKRTAAN